MSPDETNAFAEYLRANGAEILEPTNQWELLRYRLSEHGVIVVYINSKGHVKLPTHASDHFALFKKGKPIVIHERPGAKLKFSLKERIENRDGPICCFCGQFFEDEKTIEHFLEVSAGGNNHIKNLGLAHAECNHAANKMSIIEKMDLRTAMRAHVGKFPPWEAVPLAELAALGAEIERQR